MAETYKVLKPWAGKNEGDLITIDDAPEGTTEDILAELVASGTLELSNEAKQEVPVETEKSIGTSTA